jgi:hypothetical protein
VLGVDVLLAKVLQGLPAEGVLAHTPHERHAAPGARRGHRLVGALPAGGLVKVTAQHRLSRPGELRDLDGQVRVRASDDDDVSHVYDLWRLGVE